MSNDVERCEKMKNKIIGIFVVLLFVSTTLCGCSGNGVELKDSFLSYYKDEFIDNIIELPSGFKVSIFKVNKEKTNSNPHIIVDVLLANDNNAERDKEMYEWLKMDDGDKKADLKYIGEKYIEFSKSKKWSNNYYLYTAMFDTTLGQCLYDYENSSLRNPKMQDLFIEMYEEFKTMNENEVAETPKGQKFLIDNEVAELKHGELEWTDEFRNSWWSYVDVDSEGKYHWSN